MLKKSTGLAKAVEKTLVQALSVKFLAHWLDFLLAPDIVKTHGIIIDALKECRGAGFWTWINFMFLPVHGRLFYFKTERIFHTN